MVPIKGKSQSVRVMGDPKTIKTTTGGVRNLKIHTENNGINYRKTNTHGSASLNLQTLAEEKSVPVSSANSSQGALDNPPVSKNDLKSCDKSKGKRDGSGFNVKRKVLADISNVKGSFSRTKSHDGIKPMRDKSDKIPYLQWTSMGTGTRSSVSSSAKPLLGRVLTNTSKTSELKTTKTVSNDQKTKLSTRKSVTITSRASGKNFVPPTRNSYPVSKQVNKDSSRDSNKGNEDSSGKARGKLGFPVKPKVGRNVVSQACNSQSHLWRNRASDGFLVIASKCQTKVDGRSVREKSIKAGKAISAGSNAPNIPKSTYTSRMKGSISNRAVTFPGDEDKGTSSLPKETAPLACSREQVHQEVPTDDGKSISSCCTLDINFKRKSGRRKSYTSSLVTRSKLVEEHKESLPNIYDDCNPLEVSEYVDDIYQYYWVVEAQNQPLKNYMEIQMEVTPHMRGILINWLSEVHLKFDLMQETLFLTVTLLDRYLSLVSIKKNEMQLVGLTALLLASKYEDFWHPRVMDLISISAESYSRDQVLGMEKMILKKLLFRLNSPTPYVFMLRFLKAAQSDTEFEHLAFYLIELCLVEYEALNYKPSLLCASAIYVARCTMQITPAWTSLLIRHARYQESEIRECAEMILRFHKAARTAMLKVTYDKYMRSEYSRVAAMKPLDSLPL